MEEIVTGWRAVPAALAEALTMNTGLEKPEKPIALSFRAALVFGIAAAVTPSIIRAALLVAQGFDPSVLNILYVAEISGQLATYLAAALLSAIIRRMDRLPHLIVGLGAIGIILYLVQLLFSFVMPSLGNASGGITLFFTYMVVRNTLRINIGWAVLATLFIALLPAVVVGGILFGTEQGRLLTPLLRSAH